MTKDKPIHWYPSEPVFLAPVKTLWFYPLKNNVFIFCNRSLRTHRWSLETYGYIIMLLWDEFNIKLQHLHLWINLWLLIMNLVGINFTHVMHCGIYTWARSAKVQINNQKPAALLTVMGYSCSLTPSAWTCLPSTQACKCDQVCEMAQLLCNKHPFFPNTT